ncbi:MAG: LacI family DNA-binding transcriptional regulator [Rectinema sp.]
MMSIKDIAKLAGVSPSTVSRVINQRKYVKPELRKRIMAVVQETGYVPNHAARSMVLKRTFTVGIVIPYGFNMFQRQLFSIIERQLETHGYHTLFFFVQWDAEMELKCLRRIKSENLDGVIMMHEVTHPDFYSYLANAPMPVVLCTFEHGNFGWPSIHVDEEAAARGATEYLIGLGHRRIGFIAGAHFSFSVQRASGYRTALESAGIGYDESLVVTATGYSAEQGRNGMLRLLERGLPPSGLFASTDELAIGAVRALYEAGYKVPDDVSVVGFDDIDVSAYLAPGLTTVAQPIEEMGLKTADVMFRLISGETSNDMSTVFGHRLVVRESTRSYKS